MGFFQGDQCDMWGFKHMSSFGCWNKIGMEANLKKMVTDPNHQCMQIISFKLDHVYALTIITCRPNVWANVRHKVIEPDALWRSRTLGCRAFYLGLIQRFMSPVPREKVLEVLGWASSDVIYSVPKLPFHETYVVHYVLSIYKKTEGNIKII